MLVHFQDCPVIWPCGFHSSYAHWLDMRSAGHHWFQDWTGGMRRWVGWGKGMPAGNRTLLLLKDIKFRSIPPYKPMVTIYRIDSMIPVINTRPCLKHLFGCIHSLNKLIQCGHWFQFYPAPGDHFII